MLLDTSFFVALFEPRDRLHLRAVAWSRALPSRLVLTEYILWESINAFSKIVDRPKASALLRFIRHPLVDLILPSPSLFQRALDLHQRRPDKSWSLTDCASFIVMRDRGMTQALSHDHHFEEAGFEALLRHDP